MQPYTFTFRARDGEVIGTLDTKCANDKAAIERGMAARPRVAAALEIVCGSRTVAMQRFEEK